MKRFFIFTLAAALAAGLSNSAWSQGGQSGGTGTSGGAGTSGTAGTAGTSGTAGTGGTGGTAGTAGAAGTAGTPGTAGAAGNAQLGAGQNQFGANTQAQAQAGTRNFGYESQSPWFNDAGARQQLNLNDNQYNQLSRAYQNAYGRYNQAMTGLDRNLNEQQRAQQMQQFQSRFNQDFNTSLDSTFNNPQARQRYNQLYWQYQGPAAFTDPAIQQRLNITGDQRQQLRGLADDWRQQLNQLRSNAATDPNATAQQWQTLREQYQNRLGTILSPAQQQSWSQMVGQQYQFPVSAYMPSAAAGERGTIQNQQQTQQQNQQTPQRAGRTAPGAQQGTVR